MGIGRKLSLNLGFRVARDDGYIPEQCRDAGTFKDPSGQPIYPAQCNAHIPSATQWSVSPRLYFSWDVMGDGKTAVKGGWGRFADWRNGNHVLPNNPNVALQKVYTWRDTTAMATTIRARSTSPPAQQISFRRSGGAMRPSPCPKSIRTSRRRKKTSSRSRSNES